MKVEKLLEMKSRMERIIANYIAKMGEDYAEGEEGVNIITPPADTYLDGVRQIMFIETPSMDMESVNISCKNNMLVFKADKVSAKTNKRKYLHMERSLGSYFKLVPLQKEEKDIEEIKFTYKYGVIKITVWYKEQS